MDAPATIWLFRHYDCDGTTQHESFHATEEAALRQGCFILIQEELIGNSLAHSANDDERQFVDDFYRLVEAGALREAIDRYQEYSNLVRWDERVVVESCPVILGSDVPLVTALSELQAARPDDEDDEEEEEEEEADAEEEEEE